MYGFNISGYQDEDGPSSHPLSLSLSLSPFPLFISYLILKCLNIEIKYCVKNSHLRDICPLTESLPWKFYTSFVSKVTLNTWSEAGCAILYFRKHINIFPTTFENTCWSLPHATFWYYGMNGKVVNILTDIVYFELQSYLMSTQDFISRNFP